MPRLYKRKARRNIWQMGIKKPANNKQGFTINRSVPRLFLEDGKPACDILLVKKGETYYTWHPKGQDWQYSLTEPDLRRKPNEWETQLAEWEAKVVEFEEWGNNDEDADDYEVQKDSLITEIEDKISELETNLEAMPEQLQESHINTERIQTLQELLERLN